MIVVLVVAAGAAWESPALTALGEHPRTVVLKRCVDVDDLLAAASAGQAQVAVLGLESRGLDAAAVARLHDHGVRAVAVVPDDQRDAGRVRASRIGIATVVTVSAVATLPDAVLAADAPATLGPPPAGPPDAAGPTSSSLPDTDLVPSAPGGPAGRVVVVWGPAGAPGRSTVAAAVAAELARRGRRTMLVDADPYGGTVGQQLGIMDEVSGLLSAARLATAGELGERFTTVQRALDPRLSVVTGLPRPDRWSEVRPGTVEHLLELGRGQGEVVVDTGFSLEGDAALDLGARPSRNQLTLGALDVADEVLVVGGADPVGLSRLARALVDLRVVLDTGPPRPVRVVVNRMRPSLGWSEKDIAGMVAGFGRIAGLHFLPDDRVAVDRALVAGRTLLESGESPLTRAVAVLVDSLNPR
ncbi:chromosome partitioning protein [Nocardioides dongxiaopingii]|uniref:AAA family ATPase n=1 Tax=Nocardioides sp. S-1144 TaxID=2582905 RepID=UPI00110F488E|nr:chromosome partitioning protein [Nocardioides sp. S-1144]QCW49852.1 chromosome partitioning protein [Nocardioides sp. S-1144]